MMFCFFNSLYQNVQVGGIEMFGFNKFECIVIEMNILSLYLPSLLSTERELIHLDVYKMSKFGNIDERGIGR